MMKKASMDNFDTEDARAEAEEGKDEVPTINMTEDDDDEDNFG